MTRDSEEYEQFKAEYEADQKYRQEHTELFPYFAYFQFGWHNMRYISEEELTEFIKFYHLKKIGDRWERYGRQPITIMKRSGEGWR